MLGIHLPQFSECSYMYSVCTIQICCIRSMKVLVLAGGCQFAAKRTQNSMDEGSVVEILTHVGLRAFEIVG